MIFKLHLSTEYLTGNGSIALLSEAGRKKCQWHGLRVGQVVLDTAYTLLRQVASTLTDEPCCRFEELCETFTPTVGALIRHRGTTDSIDESKSAF